MALSPANAIEAAKSILAGPRTYEQPRLDALSLALRSNAPTVTVPDRSSDQLKDLARKSQTNYLPLVLDTTSQVLRVEGYRAAGAAENSRPWRVWQRNQMDARQTGLCRSALHFGASYATVLPGRVDAGADFPVIEGFSPRQMTAVYQNPSRDEWPMMALDVQGQLLRLFDEECVYYIGAENEPRSAFIDANSLWNTYELKFIEARAHGLGVCPVVRFRDRMLLEGEEQFGIIEPLISMQQRIDETTFGLLVTQFYAAFKQRYVIGWMPESEEERLKASASQLWTFKDPPSEVNVGELSESDLTRYLESKNSAVQDMAAIAQVPPTSLGVTSVSNISAEALAAFQEGKDRKAEEITTSLGESYEQMFRLAARVDGDSESAQDFEAQVRWKDATARSLAQTTDALVKWVTGLGVPAEYAWSKLPGVSDQDLELIRRKAAEEAAEAEEKAAEIAAAAPVKVESQPAL